MLATLAVPLSSRYSTSHGFQRHASLQRHLQPRPAALGQRCMAFDVTLVTPEGEKTIQCDESTLLLDAADEAGLDLPYSCRSGSCGTCAAKIESGDISKIEQVSYDICPDRSASCLHLREQFSPAGLWVCLVTGRQLFSGGLHEREWLLLDMLIVPQGRHHCQDTPRGECV